jgi:hypothetical protein
VIGGRRAKPGGSPEGLTPQAAEDVEVNGKVDMLRRLIVPGRLGLLALVLGGIVQSQAPRMAGPILGYVFDPAVEGVRPIHGIPGAATLADPLELGVALYDAAVSPQQDYILAFAGAERKLALIRTAGEAPSITLLPGAWPVSGRIILSPTGARALLYEPSASRLQVIAGLPQSPSLAGVFDLSAVSGEASALAISDDGSTVLVGAGGGLFLVGADGPPRLLAAPGEVSAVAFFINSAEAVFADRVRNTVHRLRDPAGSGEMVVLAGEQDGISEPVAVAVSGDNARVFIANRGSARVGIVPAAGGPLAPVSCECSLMALQRLDGSSTFRLSEPSSTPLWLLEAAGEPRVVFVPPGRRGAPEVW